jgi:hypothetical protein
MLRNLRRAGRRGLGRGNVAAEFLGLGVNLLEALLHDVADTDDALKCAILDDRQVANALARHHFHQIDQLVAGGAGLDLAGHQLAGRKCEDGVVMFGDPAHDIAFRDDPKEMALFVDDRYCSNAMLGEDLRDRSNRLGGSDGDDFTTFVLQD